VDTTDELPPEARVINPYTKIGFVSQGGHYIGEYRVGHEFLGNKSSITLHYTITGDDVSTLDDRITDELDAFYDLHVWKRFDGIYNVEVAKFCGLTLEGTSQHQAWWSLFIRWLPDWIGTRGWGFSLGTPLTLQPCPDDEHKESTSSTSSSAGGGGSITITTCWYWATIVGGRVVNIELDYCDRTVIPIDENFVVNAM
jgi:hypothetical protein